MGDLFSLVMCINYLVRMIFLLNLFVHFLCLPLCPVFKGAKKMNQQRSGERKGSQSLAVSLLARLWRTALRCSQSADASESRRVYAPLWGTPPSRLSALCCAARLRGMAQKTYSLT